MSKKRTVCVVTGTRAEYGLLYWLMKAITSDDKLSLKLIVTGMHLSPEFGLTYRQIEKDGFTINQKVEMLLSSDTPVGIGKSMGVALMGFAEAFDAIKPDILVVLGDRFEIFSAVSAAMVANVPVAHLHGGETTQGVFDESIRHAITKMSHLHFTATETFRQRVIQLGEQPDRVFNVGAAGIDNIKQLKLLSRQELEESMRFRLGKRNLLVTFHPVTLEKSTAEVQMANLLQVLDELEDTHIIFTKSNADTGGRMINRMIEDYAALNDNKAAVYTSLGQLRYLSAMQYMDAVVGNSSSGLIEAPSFKIGTIDIGDRQKGRTRGESVISCDPSVESIRRGFGILYSAEFQQKLNTVVNPYGQGGTAEKVTEILRSYSLEGILKKPFYDLRRAK